MECVEKTQKEGNMMSTLNSIRKPVVAAIVLNLVFNLGILRHANSQEEVPLTAVTSYWRYELDASSSWPYRVYVHAEIKNESDRYVKNVVVRWTLFTASGREIDHRSGEPVKPFLKPGESTFFSGMISDDNPELSITSRVDFLTFGDASSEAEYPYLSDPEPVYLQTSTRSGSITYYVEIRNDTSQSWKANCTYCDALYLIGAYYSNG